jgi:hypothetical protein
MHTEKIHVLYKIKQTPHSAVQSVYKICVYTPQGFVKTALSNATLQGVKMTKKYISKEFKKINLVTFFFLFKKIIMYYI